jgi:hypothetical protein
VIQQVSRCLGVQVVVFYVCSSLLLAGEVVSCYMCIGNSMFWHTGIHVLVLYMYTQTTTTFMYVHSRKVVHI